MTDLLVLPLAPDGRDRGPALPAGSRFSTLRVLAVTAARRLLTGDEETCALLLAGTFDLCGNGTNWPSRGARADVFAGRPVAVFLPPRAEFALDGGQGEILLVAARPQPQPAARGRAALSQSPLLPLAGSGKAFDPASGEWRPAETFPTAAESLPPRRIERVAVGRCTVERVFAADYKASTLTVDEVVVPASAELRVGELPLPRARESLLYLRSAQPLAVAAGPAQMTVHGEACVLAGAPAQLVLRAGAAPAYAVLAYAGK